MKRDPLPSPDDNQPETTGDPMSHDDHLTGMKVCQGKVIVRAKLANGRNVEFEADLNNAPKHPNAVPNQHDRGLLQGYNRVDWNLRPTEAAILDGLLIHLRAMPTEDNPEVPDRDLLGVLATIIGDPASLEAGVHKFENRLTDAITRKQATRARKGLPPLVIPAPPPDRGLDQAASLFKLACTPVHAEKDKYRTAWDQSQADGQRYRRERDWLSDVVRLIYRAPAWKRFLFRLLFSEIFSQERMPETLKKTLPDL